MFTIGDRVVPISKSTGCSFESFSWSTHDVPVFFKKHGYIIVSSIDDDGDIICYVSVSNPNGDGLRFRPRDLIKFKVVQSKVEVED